MKALYPNTPVKGSHGSSRNSVRSEKSERRRDRGSKDSTKESTSSRESRESKRESREIKRQRSISDAGTWDTNSIMTHDFAPTTITTNAPYPFAYDSRRDSKELKRESREIRRQRSISDAGTWDTNTEITHHAPPTTVSTNVPYPTGLPWELKRSRSISDCGTWDTSSEVTQRGPATTVSTNVPYPMEQHVDETERWSMPPPRNTRRMSISDDDVSDAGTWDTSTEITHRAPPTTVSTNVPYPTQLPRQLRRLSVSDAGASDDGVSDAGTWDTNTEITYRTPPTTISTNMPYSSGLHRQLRRLSGSDAGTWDTSSEVTQVTHRAPPTTVSTNVPYPTGHFSDLGPSSYPPGPFEQLKRVEQLRKQHEHSFSDDGSDSGTWDTSSEITHANNGPATAVSTNKPYHTERPRNLRRQTSPTNAGM
jgi:hypothetical protein